MYQEHVLFVYVYDLCKTNLELAYIFVENLSE